MDLAFLCQKEIVNVNGLLCYGFQSQKYKGLAYPIFVHHSKGCHCLDYQ